MEHVCYCGRLFEDERDMTVCVDEHLKNGFEDDQEIKERLALIFNLTAEEIDL